MHYLLMNLAIYWALGMLIILKTVLELQVFKMVSVQEFKKAILLWF